MSASGCFQNIIGLSRTPCPCTDEGIPLDADVSASGVYLDEMQGLNIRSVQAASDGCVDLWTMMERARENALRDMKTDTLACIRAGSNDTRKANTSIIGEWDQSTRLLTETNTYVGMMLRTAEMVGGTLTLKKIGIKVDTSGPIDVSVYDRDNLVNTYTITAVAGVLSWLTLDYPLELTMAPDGALCPKYYLLWQPNGIKPYNTRLHCGCPGKGWLPYYDDANPYWDANVKRRGFEWTQWVMATGVKGDDLTTRDTWNRTNDLHGLVAEFTFACDKVTTLCEEDPDYTDPLQMQQALAVQARAAYYITSFIKSSGNVSFYTLLEGEELIGRMEAYNSAYKDYISYLCDEFTKPENINNYGDCLSCKDEWGFKVSTIHP